MGCNSGFKGLNIFRATVFVLFLAQQSPPPLVGHCHLIDEVSRSHTTTHHICKDSSGRMTSSSQRTLPANTLHSQQTFMSSVGFEHTISEGERPQTYALDRAATGTGCTTVQPSHKFNTNLLHHNIYCWLVL